MDLVAVGPPDEALLLDLLNTTPVVDGAPRDDLADSAAAKAWMRERGVTPTKEEMAALVEARSILQKVVRGEARPKALKQFLETVRLRPVAGADGFDWRLDVERHPQGRGAGGAGLGCLCGFPVRADCARVRTPNAGCSLSTAASPTRRGGVRWRSAATG